VFGVGVVVDVVDDDVVVVGDVQDGIRKSVDPPHHKSREEVRMKKRFHSYLSSWSGGIEL
jgi:hypothetical protein